MMSQFGFSRAHWNMTATAAGGRSLVRFGLVFVTHRSLFYPALDSLFLSSCPHRSPDQVQHTSSSSTSYNSRSQLHTCLPSRECHCNPRPPSTSDRSDVIAINIERQRRHSKMSRVLRRNSLISLSFIFIISYCKSFKVTHTQGRYFFRQISQKHGGVTRNESGGLQRTQLDRSTGTSLGFCLLYLWSIADRTGMGFRALGCVLL